MQAGKNRLMQLEGLRIIAIIMIALSHMEFLYTGSVTYPYSAFYKLHLHNPDLGVDYFFLLSGFGMYMASRRAENTEVTIKGSFRFAWNKIRRVYPFYLVSMALMLPFQLGVFLTGRVDPAALRSLLPKLPFILTLTQTLTGIRSFSRVLNSVCWFLSSLAVVYLFSPAVLHFLKRRVGSLKQTGITVPVTFLLLLFFTWFLLLFDRNRITGRPIFDDLFYSSPYIRVFYVALGMEIGMLYGDLSDRVRISTGGEVCAALIGFLYFWCKRLLPESSVSEIILVRAIDVAVCGIVLSVFSLGGGRLSASLGKLGKVSGYTVYIFLFHYPLRFYVDMAFGKLHIDLGSLTGIIETLVIFALSILAAVVCRRLQGKEHRARKTTGACPPGPNCL